jgi:prepilin-type N-terminal cleavage/methylation domain-containing protein
MRPRHTGSKWARGYGLLELIVVLGIAGTLSAMATPQRLGTIDDARAVGAVRYISTRLQETRMEAITRNVNVAMRFTLADGVYGYTVYRDGNGNGVLSRDITRGVDAPIRAMQRLPDQFTGIDFGALEAIPPADGSGPAPGTDPIRLGASDMVSFTAAGTSSTGTLYIRGHRNAQYAIVIFGETGKTRIVKYDASIRGWRTL